MKKSFSDPSIRLSSLVIILIIVAAIGLSAAYIGRIIDKKPIALIAEDYSSIGGITPEDYFTVSRVIPGEIRLLGKKFPTVYKGDLPAGFDCSKYTKENPDKYTYCSENSEGVFVEILSSTLPGKQFRVVKWDIKY